MFRGIWYDHLIMSLTNSPDVTVRPSGRRHLHLLHSEFVALPNVQIF